MLVLENKASVSGPIFNLEIVFVAPLSDSDDISALNFGASSQFGFCEECLGGVTVGELDLGDVELFMMFMIWDLVDS